MSINNNLPTAEGADFDNVVDIQRARELPPTPSTESVEAMRRHPAFRHRQEVLDKMLASRVSIIADTAEASSEEEYLASVTPLFPAQ